jgi:GT2 family glycosyltransferase
LGQIVGFHHGITPRKQGGQGAVRISEPPGVKDSPQARIGLAGGWIAGRDLGLGLGTMQNEQPNQNVPGKIRIGVICVNWCRAQDTLDAYASLTNSSRQDWWLYVVDNASQDGSYSILQDSLGDQTTLISNPTNAGFSGGCNVGIKRALDDGATHIFLLNNDAKVEKNALDLLIQASASLGEKAALGSAVMYDGTNKYQFFGSRIDQNIGHPVWLRDKDLHQIKQTLIPTDFILGAALFAPAEIWRTVGFFNERFYLNFEETDWCYRARKLKFDCYIVPKSLTFHKAGATLGPIDAPLQIYFLSRNELLFSSYHASLKQKITLQARSANVLIKSIIKDILIYGSIKPTTKAHAIAIYDFLRGKFGDCPEIVRTYALSHNVN